MDLSISWYYCVHATFYAAGVYGLTQFVTNFCNKKKIIPENKPMRIYIDGCWDVCHSGHYNAIRQARNLGGKNVILIAGIHSDKEIEINKRKPVMNNQERTAIIKGCKWVDEIAFGLVCCLTFIFYFLHLFYPSIISQKRNLRFAPNTILSQNFFFFFYVCFYVCLSSYFSSVGNTQHTTQLNTSAKHSKIKTLRCRKHENSTLAKRNNDTNIKQNEKKKQKKNRCAICSNP